MRSVVLYTRETGTVVASPFLVSHGAGEEGLRYSYNVVQLWREPPKRVMALPDPALWPLAPLMAGSPIETTALVAERILEAPISEAELSELTGLLVTAAGIRLSRPLFESLLRRNAMLRGLLDISSPS